MADTGSEKSTDTVETQRVIDDLRTKLERRQVEFDVIQTLSNEIATTLDINRIFSFVFQNLDQNFGFKHTLILLKEPGADAVKVAASHGYGDSGTGATVPFGQGVIGVVAKRRKLMRSVGLQYQMVYARMVGEHMSKTSAEVTLPGLPDVKSQLAMPLLAKDELIGVLAVESNEANAFALLDEMILSIVGNQIAIAIQNARAFEQIQQFSAGLEAKVKERTAELERYANNLKMLNEMSQAYNTATTIDEIFQNTAKYMSRIFGSARSSIATYQEDTQTFEIVNIEGDKVMPLGEVIPVENSRLGKVFADHKIYNSPDISKLPEVDSKFFAAHGMNSLINCLLIAGGRKLGTLNMASEKFSAFDDQDEFMLFHISASLAASLELRRENLAVKEKVVELNILTENLTISRDASEKARAESDKLLLNILPAPIAEELKATQRVTPQHFDSVSVLFTDFVGFTKVAETMSPAELVSELDGCFSQFDEVARRNGMEKLKTIGDAYMCAAGLPEKSPGHPVDACLTALEFCAFTTQMAEIKARMGLDFWRIRIGVHSGPVTAGVIGTNKFAYDIWGDTVNTASRMESSGTPDRVNVSAATYELVKDFFDFEYRGEIEAKGKGKVGMYYLLRIKPELSADAEGRIPNRKFVELRNAR